MPAWCRAARKPASSPSGGSGMGSPYAGAARPTMTETPNTASSSFHNSPFSMPTYSVDLQNALPTVLLAQPIGNCAAIWADDSATTLGNDRRDRCNRSHEAPTANSSNTELGCPLAQLRIRRHNLGLLFQVHRVDAGLLRQLLEQTVKTFLIDTVVLDAFGLLRYLCYQTLQLLRRLLIILEVFERGETAADAITGHNVGSPGA